MRILRSKNAPPPSAGGGNTPDSAEPGHTSLPTYATPGDSPPGPWSRLPGRRAGWVWQHLSPVSQSLPPLPSPSSPLHWSTRPPPPTSPVSRTPVTIIHTLSHTSQSYIHTQHMHTRDPRPQFPKLLTSRALLVAPTDSSTSAYSF